MKKPRFKKEPKFISIYYENGRTNFCMSEDKWTDAELVKCVSAIIANVVLDFKNEDEDPMKYADIYSEIIRESRRMLIDHEDVDEILNQLDAFLSMCEYEDECYSEPVIDLDELESIVGGRATDVFEDEDRFEEFNKPESVEILEDAIALNNSSDEDRPKPELVNTLIEVDTTPVVETHTEDVSNKPPVIEITPLDSSNLVGAEILPDLEERAVYPGQFSQSEYKSSLATLYGKRQSDRAKGDDVGFIKANRDACIDSLNLQITFPPYVEEKEDGYLVECARCHRKFYITELSEIPNFCSGCGQRMVKPKA